jgi:hypothetical protein
MTTQTLPLFQAMSLPVSTLAAFEATVHNTRELRCRRSLENFAEIITLLAAPAGGL